MGGFVHPTLKITFALCVAFMLLLYTQKSQADGGAHTSRGRARDVLALTYHWDQSKAHTYVTTIQAPMPGLLERLAFAANNPGSNGAGSSMTIEVVRAYVGDGGFSAQLCELVVPCAAPAGPTGHYYAACGGESGVEIEAGDLFSVRISSNGCATTPDGNVTILGSL